MQADSKAESLDWGVQGNGSVLQSPGHLRNFEHLVGDDADHGEGSRFAHYLEWATDVKKIVDDVHAKEKALKLMEMRHSIHFHVWDGGSWLDFLVCCRTHLDNRFELVHYELAGPGSSVS